METCCTATIMETPSFPSFHTHDFLTAANGLYCWKKSPGDCYTGALNMSERHQRDDLCLWPGVQGATEIVNPAGPGPMAMNRDNMKQMPDIRQNTMGMPSYGAVIPTSPLIGIHNNNQQNSQLVIPHPVKPTKAQKTYTCKMCDQVFNTKSDMLIHSQQIHKQDPKPYKCPTCLKSFANSSYLSQHNRIHAGIKPYKCEICERKFTQLSHLQQHIRTHTGEKPYKCSHPGCGKAFSQLSNLQSHSRSHMTDKPYRCNSCYKCYTDEAGLRDHIPKHSDTKHLKTHICRVCGKSYTQETYLARHMAKHSQDGMPKINRGVGVGVGGVVMSGLSGPHHSVKQEPLDHNSENFPGNPVGLVPGKGSSAFMAISTQYANPGPIVPSTGSYPYGLPLPTSSPSSPLPHISSMTSARYFPYDPLSFRPKSEPPARNLNVASMSSRDSMLANSLLSLQHIKDYASQQMPSFTNVPPNTRLT